MSISRELINRIPEHLDNETVTVSVDQEPRRLDCRLVSAESLSVRFASIRLETSELAAATVEELRQLSDELARRVNYLLEPIGPIEVNREQCIVQMRSVPPQADGDARSYYEMLVERGGRISLVRYRKTPGKARQPILATVTREVLARLVGDFEAVLDGAA